MRPSARDKQRRVTWGGEERRAQMERLRETLHSLERKREKQRRVTWGREDRRAKEDDT